MLLVKGFKVNFAGSHLAIGVIALWVLLLTGLCWALVGELRNIKAAGASHETAISDLWKTVDAQRSLNAAHAKQLTELRAKAAEALAGLSSSQAQVRAAVAKQKSLEQALKTKVDAVSVGNFILGPQAASAPAHP